MITLDGKLVNKANSYEVKFNPQFWRAIKHLVEQWRESRKPRPWWVSPNDEAKTAQHVMAWEIKNQLRRDYTHGERLKVSVWLRGQKIDIDGIKGLLDALEQSGRIGNDNQVDELIITRVPSQIQAVDLAVEPV